MISYDKNTDFEDEETKLLDSSNRYLVISRGQSYYYKYSAFLLIICTVFYSFLLLSGWYSTPVHKRNVIFMVSDGFGPASETYSRSFYQYLLYKSLPDWRKVEPRQMPLDSIFVGQSRTRSSSSWITDSAAGATAFSTGFKSYNGAIGVDESHKPISTILEAAKLQGMKTGLVVTSSITDATPAAFSAHTTSRRFEDIIACQQIGNTTLGRSVDLMFGGGRKFFLPTSVEGGSRQDGRNLFQEAKDSYGFKTTLTSRAEFDALKSNNVLPLLGLFADYHIPYEIDRDPNTHASLKEMAVKALDILTESTKNDEQGFFMMIEGSRIDMASHNNDAAAHAYEILAYQETINAVKQYVDEHPGTIMISVSDHETGGLTLGRQVGSEYPNYEWFPNVVAAVQNSTEAISSMILRTTITDRVPFVRDVVLPQLLGISDFEQTDITYLSASIRTQTELINYLSELVNVRALIGYTTHGHTGVDVNLYAYSGATYPLSHLISPLRRNLENIELYTFMEKYLNLGKFVNSLTQRLVNGVIDGSLIIEPEASEMNQQYIGSDIYHLNL